LPAGGFAEVRLGAVLQSVALKARHGGQAAALHLHLETLRDGLTP